MMHFLNRRKTQSTAEELIEEGYQFLEKLHLLQPLVDSLVLTANEKIEVLHIIGSSKNKSLARKLCEELLVSNNKILKTNTYLKNNLQQSRSDFYRLVKLYDRNHT